MGALSSKFDPIQEIGPKVGGGRSFVSGRSFFETMVFDSSDCFDFQQLHWELFTYLPHNTKHVFACIVMLTRSAGDSAMSLLCVSVTIDFANVTKQDISISITLKIGVPFCDVCMYVHICQLS